MPTGRARQPRVEHHALADVEALGLGAELGDLGDHLVAHHLRERAEPAHGVVLVAVTEVQEDLLRVGAADAGEQRPGDEPVGPQRPGVGDRPRSATGVTARFCSRGGASGGGVYGWVDVPNTSAFTAILRSSASSLVKLRFEPHRNSGGSRWRATTAPRNDAGTYCSCSSPFDGRDDRVGHLLGRHRLRPLAVVGMPARLAEVGGDRARAAPSTRRCRTARAPRPAPR